MSNVRFFSGQLPAGATTQDIVPSGETDTPVGAIIFYTHLTGLNSTGSDATFGFGVSDFTTSAAVGSYAQSGLTTSNAKRIHRDGKFFVLNDPGATSEDRTATVSAISGGIRITTDQAGVQHRYFGLIFYNCQFKAFSSGAGTTSGNTFNWNHSFGVNPSGGIFSTTDCDDSGNNHTAQTLGFWEPTQTRQYSVITRFRDAQTTNGSTGIFTDDFVSGLRNNSTGYINSVAVSSYGTSNVTFTVSNGTLNGQLIGALFKLDEPFRIAQISGPNSTASAWQTGGSAAQPQAGIIVAGRYLSIDDGNNNDADAGTFSVACVDDNGGEGSISNSNEDDVTTSDCRSRISDELFFLDHDGSVDYRLHGLSPGAEGYNVNAADIDNADAADHQWLIAYFGLGTIYKSASDGGTWESTAETPIGDISLTLNDQALIFATETAYRNKEILGTDAGDFSSVETASSQPDLLFKATSDVVSFGATEDSLIESDDTAVPSGDDEGSFDVTETSTVDQFAEVEQKSSTDAANFSNLQATNLLLWSDSYLTSPWTRAGFVTANVANGPEGQLTADRFICSNFGVGSLSHVSQTVTLTADAYYVLSHRVKFEVDTNWIYFSQINFSEFTDYRAYFRITPGLEAVGTLGSSILAAGVVNEGNGWFRLYVAFQASPTDVTGSFRFSPVEADGVPYITSTPNPGTDHSHLMGGTQLELVSSNLLTWVPKVYIPTMAAAASVGLENRSLFIFDASKSASENANSFSAVETFNLNISGTFIKTSSDSADFSASEIVVQGLQKSSSDTVGGFSATESRQIAAINYDPSWEDDDVTWGGLLLSSKDLAPVGIFGKEFKALGIGEDQNLSVYLERRAVVYDGGRILIGRGVYPQILGPIGEKVLISLGAHDSPDGSIDYEGPYEFTIGEDIMVDFAVSGQYLAVRFETEELPIWRLSGFSIDYAVVGEH